MLGVLLVSGGADPPAAGVVLDHPDALTRSAEAESAASAETKLLRRALLDDDPPGARARAQDRAHDLLRSSSPRLPTWWRFEEPGRLDCVLATDQLFVSITAPGALAACARRPVVPAALGARARSRGRSAAGRGACLGWPVDLRRRPPAEVA